MTLPADAFTQRAAERVNVHAQAYRPRAHAWLAALLRAKGPHYRFDLEEWRNDLALARQRGKGLAAVDSPLLCGLIKSGCVEGLGTIKDKVGFPRWFVAVMLCGALAMGVCAWRGDWSHAWSVPIIALLLPTLGVALWGIVQELRVGLSPLDEGYVRRVRQLAEERGYIPWMAAWLERLGELRMMELRLLMRYEHWHAQGSRLDYAWQEVQEDTPLATQVLWQQWQEGRRLPSWGQMKRAVDRLKVQQERYVRQQLWREGAMGQALNARMLESVLPEPAVEAPRRRL